MFDRIEFAFAFAFAQFAQHGPSLALKGPMRKGSISNPAIPLVLKSYMAHVVSFQKYVVGLMR